MKLRIKLHNLWYYTKTPIKTFKNMWCKSYHLSKIQYTISDVPYLEEVNCRYFIQGYCPKCKMVWAFGSTNNLIVTVKAPLKP